jgi:hypothetical protein
MHNIAHPVAHGVAWALLALLLSAGHARADVLTLAWDHSQDPGIAGYRLYWGNHPRGHDEDSPDVSSPYPWDMPVDLQRCKAGTCSTPPLEFDAGPWYFAVTAVSRSGTPSKFSEEVSKVIPDEPTLFFPHDAPAMAMGCQYTIRWSGFQGDRVSIHLLKDGGAVKTISRSTANDGAFLWRVPKKKLSPAEGFTVRVSAGAERVESAAPFEILSPAVTAPSSGEILSRGAAELIRWEPAGFCQGPVSVSLRSGKKASSVIAPNAPNTGAWTWIVPQEQKPGSRFRIQVQSTLNPACRGVSPGYFTVQ